MVIIDGLGDEPIPALGGKTPLESAFIPNIHYMANRGTIGRINTVFPGFPIESMVCIMGLLGFDPKNYYPNGRASFEAIAKGIPLRVGDLVLRCNTVTVDLRRQTLCDFTAGLISDSDARSLIGQISLPRANWEIYPGQSYRNILIVRDADIDVSTLSCREPHMHIGESVADILPCSTARGTHALSSELSSFLMCTQQQIAAMELPPSCVANMLWLWSPSRKPVWPSFFECTRRTSAVVGGLDFLHGIAAAAKMRFDIIPGATGYIDTNYKAKADYALRHLKDYDFVLVHVNATDEEAHQHNHMGKIKAIENVDRQIVGPVLNALVKQYGTDFRIAVCGDHTTRCCDGKHTGDPVPFALFGSGAEISSSPGFCETTCARFTPIPSLEFLPHVWK